VELSIKTQTIPERIDPRTGQMLPGIYTWSVSSDDGRISMYAESYSERIQLDYVRQWRIIQRELRGNS